MPSGGRRIPGPGKKIGRPSKRDQLARLEQLHQEVELTVEEFKGEVRKGITSGVGTMMKSFPRMVRQQIARAESGDKQAEQFLIDRVMKFIQPAMLQQEEAPLIRQFMQNLKAELAAPAEPAVVIITPSDSDYDHNAC